MVHSKRELFNSKMQILREQLFSQPIKISHFLQTIFKESRKATQNINTIYYSHSVDTKDLGTKVVDPKSQNNLQITNGQQKIPPWHHNTIQNKGLYNFYEHKFWELYDILQTDRNYIFSMVILHQTKLQNHERLLKLSIQRNEYLNVTEWCKHLDRQNYILLIQKKKKIMDFERNINQNAISFYNKPIVMFEIGSFSQSPTKRQTIFTDRRLSSVAPSTKTSPVRRTMETNEKNRNYNPSPIQQPQLPSKQSHIKFQSEKITSCTLSTQIRRPINIIRPESRYIYDDTNKSLVTYSPERSNKYANLNKSVVLNFPELKSKFLEPSMIIHHKCVKVRENTKKLSQDFQNLSNSNLLFSSSTSNHGVTAILQQRNKLKLFNKNPDILFVQRY